MTHHGHKEQKDGNIFQQRQTFSETWRFSDFRFGNFFAGKQEQSDCRFSQKEREQKAADRIFALLPEDQGEKFRSLWEEFEAANTPESRFAHTMDNVQPLMLNAATNGKSWGERGVHLSQILKRNAFTKDGSDTLWKYAYQNFIAPNVESGKIIKDTDMEDMK